MQHSTLKCAVIALSFLALGACNKGRSSAEALVLTNLKDPDSAKFGDYVEVLSKKRDWACLAVNAKNSMGGYTGEQSARFVRDAGAESWKFDSIAPQSFDQCVKMLKDMQPFEGGPR
jgi:hypothetical protein